MLYKGEPNPGEGHQFWLGGYDKVIQYCCFSWNSVFVRLDVDVADSPINKFVIIHSNSIRYSNIFSRQVNIMDMCLDLGFGFTAM